jgi:multiple sugar transport system substrate-binding protein
MIGGATPGIQSQPVGSFEEGPMSNPLSANRFSRRQFLRGATAAGAAVSLFALAGCPAPAPAVQTGGEAAAPAAAQSETVLFWKPPHSEREADLWPPLLKKFSDANPGITVEHQVVPWGNVTQQFTAAFAGGAPPDIFYLPDEWYPKYVSDEQIADLTDLIGDWEANYTEAGWNGATYKGRVWGVPFLGVAQGWICNMNLFNEKGLSLPTNWEEFRETAKALTDPAAGTYGIAPLIDSFASWIISVPLMATGGASFMSEDLLQFAANTEGGVAAFKTLYEDIIAGDQSGTPLGFSDDQFNAAARGGQVGMQWQETSAIKAVWRTQAPDLELAAIPMLKLTEDGKNASWANIGFMFMAQQSAEKAGPFKLLEYLGADEIQVEYVQKGVDLLPLKKNIPPLPDADPLVNEIVSWLAEGYGVGTTISIRWLEANTILGQEVQSIMTGQKTAAEALASAEELINPILDGE